MDFYIFGNKLNISRRKKTISNKEKNKETIIKKFYKVKDGEKNLDLIKLKDLSVLDELYASDIIIFREDMSNKFLNFVYNLLNNNKLLKKEKITAYIIKGEQLRQKFNFERCL